MLTFANKKNYWLMIVTGKEFRSRQGKYVGAAFAGQDVVVRSRRGCFRIIPVPAAEEPSTTEEDMEQRLSGALKEVKDSIEGKTQLLSWEDMLHELDN